MLFGANEGDLITRIGMEGRLGNEVDVRDILQGTIDAGGGNFGAAMFAQNEFSFEVGGEHDAHVSIEGDFGSWSWGEDLGLWSDARASVGVVGGKNEGCGAKGGASGDREASHGGISRRAGSR